MESIKILYVEDEESLGLIVTESIESRGFDVIYKKNANEGFEAFCNDNPDICVLDIMLPDKDGFELAKNIRNINKQIPIIFLTAKSKIADIKKGFDLGAHDYIKKPFSIEELIIRIEAILRKNESVTKSDLASYHIGDYVFNYDEQQLVIGRTIKNLTSREAEILKLFVENKKNILNREIVLKIIWGDDNFFNARSMDVFITKLRKHLSKDPNIKIINIRGKGYKLID